MKKTYLLLVTLIACLSSGSVWAVNASGLYEAEVPVADRGNAARQAAVTGALRQVLTKVSGQAAAADDPAVGAALSKSSQYMQQYLYRTATDAASGGEALMLWVRFDPRSVDALIRDANLPAWGVVRPLTVVWLAVEQDGDRQLVGANDEGLAARVLRAVADQRGLPISLPLMDLQDRRAVTVADVWGNFRESLIAASKRYTAQAVLSGRLYPLRRGTWQVQWTLFRGGESQRWEATGASLPQLLGSGINGAADRLSRGAVATAAQPGSGSLLRLLVTDVADLHGYQRTLNYLSSLRGVTEVRVEAISAGSVRFQLSVSGGMDSLVQLLALGDALAPEAATADGTTEPQPGGILTYRLLP